MFKRRHLWQAAPGTRRDEQPACRERLCLRARFDAAASGMMLLALWACGEVPQEPVTESKQELSAEEQPGATDFAPDTPTPEAIVVGWVGLGASQVVTRLPAVIHNTSGEAKTVELQVAGVDPYGELVTRPVSVRSVAAQKHSALELPVAELPVQSTGLPSTIWIIARYELTQPALGSVVPNPVAMIHQVNSPAVHVTFEPGWARATVRTALEQARVGGFSVDNPPRQPEVRRIDPSSGSLKAAVPANPQAGFAPGAISVSDRLPAGATWAPTGSADTKTAGAAE